MDVFFLLKSMSIGVAVAAPVGPMSMLCIQRTLGHGRGAGLLVGAGIALADGTYAAVAAFGVAALAAALLSMEAWLKIVGAMVLIVLGARAIVRKMPIATGPTDGESGWKLFATAYGLTLTNPPTILFFAGVFASIAELSASGHSMLFAAGVVAGSMLWWALLTAVISGVRHALEPSTVRRINTVAGGVLLGFGVYGLGSVVLARLGAT